MAGRKAVGGRLPVPPRRSLYGLVGPSEATEARPVAERGAVTQAAIEAVGNAGKRGRPKTGRSEPWIEAGVSRAAWYRRKKGVSNE